MTATTARLAAIVLLAASPLGLAACGGDDGDDAASVSTRTSGAGSVTTVADLPAEDGGAPTRSGAAIDARTIYSRFGGGVVTIIAAGASGSDSGGLGSGFVVSDRGEVATNAHVVTLGERAGSRLAQEVYVRFADRNQVKATIVGTDRFNDVALLKIDPKDLDLVQLRFAAGSDARGRVIGINSQIETSSGDGSGVGFAISAQTVRRAIAQIRARGSASYPYLGVSTVGVYPQLAQEFDLGTDSGAWIQSIPDGSPGEKAGLRGPSGRERRFQVSSFAPGGDVVVGIDGRPVKTSNDLAEVVQGFRPGQTVTLRVFRGGKPKDVRVKLGRRPSVAPR
jgi:S1-C subfamily serine protease